MGFWELLAWRQAIVDDGVRWWCIGEKGVCVTNEEEKGNVGLYRRKNEGWMWSMFV